METTCKKCGKEYEVNTSFSVEECMECVLGVEVNNKQ